MFLVWNMKNIWAQEYIWFYVWLVLCEHFLFFLNFFFVFYGGWRYHDAHLKDRGQIVGVISFCPLCGLRGSNSGHQDWLQVPLLAEASHLPRRTFLLKGFYTLETTKELGSLSSFPTAPCLCSFPLVSSPLFRPQAKPMSFFSFCAWQILQTVCLLPSNASEHKSWGGTKRTDPCHPLSLMVVCLVSGFI